MAVVRLLKFFLKYLYIILIVAALCLFAGFFAYDNAYLNIVVRDGMSARAECILNDYDDETTIYKLSSLFSTTYVYNVFDEEARAFEDYESAGYRYSIKVGIAWVVPWSETCEITVEERVVDLSLKYIGEGDAAKEDIPEWIDGKYKVSCVKKNGIWKIDSIELEEVLEAAK